VFHVKHSAVTPLDALLASIVPAGSLFAVGGRVRDEVRGIGAPPKDFDYVVVGVALEELLAALRTIGRVDVVGASFAVVKVRTPAGDADVALPRRERSTGVGHRDFTIEAAPDIPLADDLGRRDFRMNMLARAIPDGALVDPYGGLADIAAERIDIVRAEAFAEDPLRMLRAAQFAARFGYTLTERTERAMTAASPLVATVSPERIGDELAKLLTLAERPSVGLEILRRTGLLAHIWPEFLEGVACEQNVWHAYDVYGHTLHTVDAAPPGDLTLRLAALFHDVGKPRVKDGPHFYRHEHVGRDLVVAMLERVRYGRELTETVAHLVRSHMYVADPELQPKSLRRFVQRIGVEHLDRLFALRAADIVGSGLPKRDDTNERFQAAVRAIVREKPPFGVRDLAIDGTVVTGLMVDEGLAAPGFRGDARVGAVLAQLFEEVTDEPARNEPSLLRERATAFVRAMRATKG
jgi:tRNA nucleotidyltransferase/poly(A) polymerase